MLRLERPRAVSTLFERSNEGVPHSEIVEYADARSIDLLVVGTEGRTGLDRLAVGSVSQRVVGSASAPF